MGRNGRASGSEPGNDQARIRSSLIIIFYSQYPELLGGGCGCRIIITPMFIWRIWRE